jgi:protein-S-isoprenylcysteine O-methyltransferase Ste14
MHSEITQGVRPFKQKRRIFVLWVLTTALITTVLVMRPIIPRDTIWHVALEVTGELAIFFGVLGRLWSALYVGGRKNAELVTEGPYSLCRNPLYLSSMLAITGICMISGSLIVSIVFPSVFLVVFIYTARKEAEYLSSKFGRVFDEYARNTPMLVPNFRGFNGTDIKISADVLMKTARDGVFLVLLVPAMRVLEYLQVSRVLVEGFPIF